MEIEKSGTCFSYHSNAVLKSSCALEVIVNVNDIVIYE